MKTLKWLPNLFARLGPCSQGLHQYKVISQDATAVNVVCRVCGKKTRAVE